MHFRPRRKLKPESQLDFHGDVYLEFVNCQQVTLCDCLISGNVLMLKNFATSHPQGIVLPLRSPWLVLTIAAQNLCDRS